MDFMNKKILGIAVIFFVFFIAGISAQSIEQQANTLLNRYEALAKAFEALAKESGELAAQQRPTKQALTRCENNRQNLLKQQSQNQADWRAFFSTDRDVTRAQQDRMNKIGDRIVLADDRIGSNIRTINSKL
jgi:chromosome segregation ATPase